MASFKASMCGSVDGRQFPLLGVISVSEQQWETAVITAVSQAFDSMSLLPVVEYDT